MSETSEVSKPVHNVCFAEFNFGHENLSEGKKNYYIFKADITSFQHELRRENFEIKWPYIDCTFYDPEKMTDTNFGFCMNSSVEENNKVFRKFMSKFDYIFVNSKLHQNFLIGMLFFEKDFATQKIVLIENNGEQMTGPYE